MSEDPPSTPAPRSWFERITQALSGEPQSREELIEELRHARANGLLTNDTLSMVEGAIEVADLTVADVMVPRAQMVSLPIDAPREQILDEVLESGHSRFPVHGQALHRHRAPRRFAQLRDRTARLRAVAGHAFLRSNGWLAAHLDPSATYKLKSWLALDNDYRKQHRIALALMREAPLHEIAKAAKAKMADVFDVVNAYDALDLIETRRSATWDPSPETVSKRKRTTRKAQQLLAATVFTR